jgi:hypothetical protein
VGLESIGLTDATSKEGFCAGSVCDRRGGEVKITEARPIKTENLFISSSDGAHGSQNPSA